MQEQTPIENQNNDSTNKSSNNNEYSKWVDNQVMKLVMFLDLIKVLNL